MLAFLIRRLGQAMAVMLIISFLSFSIQDELGDPLRELVGQSVSEETREQLRDEMGLNDPFLVQYGRFLIYGPPRFCKNNLQIWKDWATAIYPTCL